MASNKYSKQDGKPEVLYGVEERPPWHISLFLAVQQFLTCFGAVFSYPLIISTAICIVGDDVGLGELINTIIFVSGLSSILQTTIGIRLPIIQGASLTFVTPVTVLMNKNKCPIFNDTEFGTLPFERGSNEHRDIWQSNLNEISGALMIASAVQIVVGFSGLIGVLVRFIGPLTIAPTISLIGLSLFKAASDKGSSQWWICFVTIFLITLFSQYFRDVSIPFVGGTRLKIFSLFPVLIGLTVSWVIFLILTEMDLLPDHKNQRGYQDIHSSAVENAKWFRFPYPGQWWLPVVTLSGVVGMIAITIASMIESVGDYYACARLCGVASPPRSAISRGIGMEGITCLLAGAWGCGGGNTSYSESIGAIGITRVGSRFVVQIAGIIMMVLGCVGKFGALFVMLPDPVVAGLFYVMFGMVTAVGISNLQFVDLNSTRNLFVFGFSIFFGLSVPGWVVQNEFNLGNDTVNQILQVLCGTSMFVGGLVAFILDSTIPGTRKERGFLKWEKRNSGNDANNSIYELPLIQSYLLNKSRLSRLFCPPFFGDGVNSFGRETTERMATDKGGDKQNGLKDMPLSCNCVGREASVSFCAGYDRTTNLDQKGRRKETTTVEMCTSVDFDHDDRDTPI